MTRNELDALAGEMALLHANGMRFVGVLDEYRKRLGVTVESPAADDEVVATVAAGLEGGTWRNT